MIEKDDGPGFAGDEALRIDSKGEEPPDDGSRLDNRFTRFRRIL